MAAEKTRVVVVRGHQATPWELRSWELLPERFDVRFLLTRSNAYSTDDVALESVRARTVRDLLPRGRVGDLAAHALGDRYLRLGEQLDDADIVHSEELGYWFSAEVARQKQQQRYKLALTVWETLPLRESFRNTAARRRRRLVLDQTDLFLPTTERAAAALRLEDVPAERMTVSPPGIDVERFRAQPPVALREHVVLSVGRLVWEKGHQDVLRALAALRHGVVAGPDVPVRLKIVGSGPEQGRLEAHARELGLGEWVEFSSAGYDEMPELYAGASALVLASQPAAACFLGPLGIPRCFWEEQFGMVLAEAMASGLPIVASDSGATAEVTDGAAALFAAGDWKGLASSLAETVLSRPPDLRVEYDPLLVSRYSQEAAAARLAEAYDGLART